MSEHKELILGIGLGVLALGAMMVLLAHLASTHRRRVVEYQQLEAMNELKSKAID